MPAHGNAPGPDAPGLTFGRFLQAAARHESAFLAKHGAPYVVEKAAMGSSSGATGGYLVPQELQFAIMKDVAEEAIVRKFAQIVPMGSDSVLLPQPEAKTAQSAGTAPYWGGMTFVWESEAGASDENDITFGQVNLKAWELRGVVTASNALMADAPALEAALRRLFARAVAYQEDYAFLRGDGAGKPRGMLLDAVSVTRSAPNAFANADAYGMVEKLLPSAWNSAIWVAHPSAFIKFPQLTGWQPNATREPARGPAGTLHELPVYISDKLPALGTAGDVLLIDPTRYAIGDRALLIEASEHSSFTSYQTVFRVVARVGGAPWLAGAVTLADGTKTAGPYVALTT